MNKSPLLIAALLAATAPLTGSAATLYWDLNGTEAGAGTTPTGAWNTTTANWNPSADGTGTPVTFTSGAAAGQGDTVVFSAGTDATGAYTVSLPATLNAAGIVVEEGTVTLDTGVAAIGGGTVNVASGATLVTNSSLRVSATTGSIWTLNGGTLRTSNTSANGSFIDVDATITLGPLGGTIAYNVPNVLNIIQGTTVISGTGSLTKEGPGVIAIASTSTYTGPTVINDGELRIRTSANRLPTTTALTVNGPGILNLNGLNQQIGSLGGDGFIGLANGTLTVGNANSTSFSGVITDTKNAGAGGSTAVGGKFTKVGEGTLTLSGANTYTGATTITGGTLVAAGASGSLGSGSTTVQSTATKLSIQTGVLNALSDTSTLTLAGGGVAGVADVGYLELGAGINETVNMLSLGGAFVPGGTYGSSLSAATFQNDEFFSGSGILTVTIPEPSTAAVLAGGFGMLLGLQRSRRRS